MNKQSCGCLLNAVQYLQYYCMHNTNKRHSQKLMGEGDQKQNYHLWWRNEEGYIHKFMMGVAANLLSVP